MPAPLPPMFAFTTTGNRKPSARLHRLATAWLITRASRVRQAERFEQRQLPRLGDLDREALRAVHDRHAEALQVGHEAEREEHPLHAAAQVRRRTHAVEDERVRRRLLGRIVDVRARVEADERNVAALEFGEQRAEPVGVFVVDRERSRGHVVSLGVRCVDCTRLCRFINPQPAMRA